jgi:hypothetical protein
MPFLFNNIGAQRSRFGSAEICKWRAVSRTTFSLGPTRK